MPKQAIVFEKVGKTVANASKPKQNKKHRNTAMMNATIWLSESVEVNSPIAAYAPTKKTKPKQEPKVLPISIFPCGEPKYEITKT